MSRVVRALGCLLFMGCALISGGCKRNPGGTASAGVASEGSLPRVTDDTVDDLLTWVDDEGSFRVVATPDEVPPTARDVVRVTSPTVADPNPETVFVVDLRVKRPDGTYAVSAMGRASFDRMATERRKSRAQEKPDPTELHEGVAEIYGASWCGPCHQAQAWFKAAGVPFVDHDIEEDPAARAAMQAALERSGQRNGSIPVIVWRGKVLVGFNAQALEAVRSGGG